MAARATGRIMRRRPFLDFEPINTASAIIPMPPSATYGKISDTPLLSLDEFAPVDGTDGAPPFSCEGDRVKANCRASDVARLLAEPLICPDVSVSFALGFADAALTLFIA